MPTWIRPVGALLYIGIVVAMWRWTARKQDKFHLTQYLFFARLPIILALGLMIIPWAGYKLAPNLLGGMFVLRPLGIGFVAFSACACAWAITYGAAVLVYAAPVRTDLNYEKKGENPNPKIGTDGQVLSRRFQYLSLILVLPLASLLIYRADGSRVWASVAFLVGGLAAAGLREWSSARLRRSEAAKEQTEEARYKRMVARAKGFALVSAIVYAAFFVLGLYGTLEWRASIPALLYVHALILLLTVLSTWLSFVLDKFRVPIFALVFVFLVVLKSIWPADHIYRVFSWQGEQPRDIKQLLNVFSTSRHGDLIVVAASGGGITASFWTTTVLRALDTLRFPADSSFRVAPHIALISSVSGGSVGAMHYVNAFQKSGGFAKPLDDVVESSGRSSLSAVAWGMMYQDLWRLVLGSLLGRYDRAWAQERRWEELVGPGPAPTLATWTPGVNEGWRPIQIFNVTLEETGERLLVAPAKLSEVDTMAKSPALWREFWRLYDGRDVSVVTAARMSATFPFVTPHARPDVPDSLLDVAFHVADGGYYDNSGIVSGLETVGLWLKSSAYNKSASRVALIEIRAGGPIGESTERKAKTKTIHSIVGPLNTLFNVRTTSQVARNMEEITLVRDFWACHPRRPVLEHFVFRLSGDVPVSWHLTQAQKDTIQAHMTMDTARFNSPAMVRAMLENSREEARLARFFGDSQPPAKDSACVNATKK